MKETIQKITNLAICLAVMVGVPALSRADDSNRPDATTPAATPDQSGPTKEGKSRNYYGPVTAVNTNAMTFTAGGRDYIVNSKTEIHKTKGGTVPTLAGIVVGESARFTYIRGTDGKFYVTKLRLGKEADDYADSKKKKSKGSTNSDATTTSPQNQ